MLTWWLGVTRDPWGKTPSRAIGEETTWRWIQREKKLKSVIIDYILKILIYYLEEGEKRESLIEMYESICRYVKYISMLKGTDQGRR